MKNVKWGQHFLVNSHIAEKMVQRFLPVKGPILEIGPGKGILTRQLIKYCQDNKITVVELDRSLCDHLENRFNENLDIFCQNILHLHPGGLFPGEHVRVNVIGNVPYYISKELMDWVIAHHQKIKKGMFMMQKEFVDKLMAREEAKWANARAVLFNGLFAVEKLFDVQPGSFSPPPKVKSSVFLFEGISSPPGNDIDSGDFYAFLQRCFHSRRKTLLNNLAAAGLLPGDIKKLKAMFDNRRIPLK
ncbi:MAG: hypothetical protein JSV88_04970, partial [Candidatus Aminicenantes bacterium]